MSLLEHIEELRRRLLFCIFIFLCSFILSYILSPTLLSLILEPIKKEGVKVFAITPTEKISSLLKLSAVSAFGLSSPFFLHQMWGFVAPALKEGEKNLLLFPLILCVPSFFLGFIFCLYGVLPILLPFFIHLLPQIPSYITLSSYISFFLTLSLFFSLAFQMPIISFLLSKAKILHYSFLLKNAKYAIMVFLILSAIFTPPDIISQIIATAPLLALYLLCILICYIVRR